MRPYLLPATVFPFFVITIFVLIQVPASLCDDEEYYLNCSSSYQCANINVSYPFWGQGRPEYCGYPGFELNCQGDALQITIGSDIYRVLGIDNTSQTLKVARADSWNTNCSQYLVNTNLDINLFSYASTTVNLTLYYSCTTAIPVGAVSTQFSCTTNDNSVNGYYVTADLSNLNVPSGTCNNHVIVPILQTASLSIQSNLTAGRSPNLTEALDGGFDLQWSARNDLCTQCADSGGKCGYNQTTTAFVCYCANGTYVNTCGGTLSTTGSSNLNLPLKIFAGAAAGGGSIIVLFIMICCIRRECLPYKAMVFWKKRTKNDLNVGAFMQDYGSFAPKQYSYSKVKKMTNSFKDKLGQGGYGSVYKGKLTDGRLVAVKILSESKGNGEEFINEVASISRTSHVNIVTLLGFCYERTKRALIYEFMPNGSLDKFIYDRGSSNSNCQLEWKILYQIAVGIARGLEYLHRGCTTRILHFDIKPQNILLDEDFCPKISDFGLAKLCQMKESTVSMLGARGTAGYIAPEVFCRTFGGVSHKSDVYSYGMMVLEMVGGRKNIKVEVVRTSEIYFPHWIYDHMEPGEHLKLHGVMNSEEEEIARKMILVSLWCIQTIPSSRPSIRKVVEMLEGSLQSVEIPPKPFLFSPTRSPQDSSTAPLS